MNGKRRGTHRSGRVNMGTYVDSESTDLKSLTV